MSKKNLVMLLIMDGFGIRKETYGNAIAKANKPNLDKLFNKYPHTLLDASGEAVGLPMGQMGNSEVGHMNIGAGRVVYQSLTKLNMAVRFNTLKDQPAIKKAFEHSVNNKSNLHIMGLLSDGGVHSHIDHIIYLANKANEAGIKNIYIHCFLDGRDVPPKSALDYLDKLQISIPENAHIGVVSGRYYAMDRDKNYDRTQLAYNALVYGEAEVLGYKQGLDKSYKENITDEFVKPYIVTKGSNIKDNDSVIFANFRPDRAIQMSLALTNPTKTKLEKYKVFKNLDYVQMMLYSEDVISDIAFGPEELENLYGDVISKEGLKQLRIAETEKYAHVTYFFDGGVDKELEGETRILVPSPKVATYDLQPEMSAYEVCDKVCNAIKSNEFDTIILNFANPDMVGHTAVFDAAVKAIEVVDECVGKIYNEVMNVNGTLLITADHGNADEIFDMNNNPVSSHTTNPVPFLITKEGLELKDSGRLCDITPTMLDLLNIKQPVEMTGESLIKK